MNIFFLDFDVKKCAEYHCDKHVVKMILETAQLLCGVHHVTDQVTDQVPYKLSHKNHPCSIWVRSSLSNYLYLCDLGLELCKEYTYRYGKVHKCQDIGLVDKLKWFPNNLPLGKFTDPTPAMPDQYKIPDNGVQSYRNYYNGEKQRMFSWKKRQVPEFINKTTRENYANI